MWSYLILFNPTQNLINYIYWIFSKCSNGRFDLIDLHFMWPLLVYLWAFKSDILGLTLFAKQNGSFYISIICHICHFSFSKIFLIIAWYTLVPIICTSNWSPIFFLIFSCFKFFCWILLALFLKGQHFYFQSFCRDSIVWLNLLNTQP